MKILPLARRLNSEWRQKTRKMDERLREFYRIFRKEDYPTSDDLFFALEDLPYLGKEYWFLYFCAPKTGEQVVLTLGRAVEPVKVNATRLRMNYAGSGAPCAAVCWYYSGRKRVAFDSAAYVSAATGGGRKGERSLCVESGKYRASISGNYPRYSIELARGGKRFFSARACRPKKGTPFEMLHLLETPVVPRFGAAMINYYFDFRGTLEGKKLSGKAYLQKVVAAMPLTPWNWVRLSFGKGATLDFFTSQPLGASSGLRFASNNYLELGGRRIMLKKLMLSSHLAGEKKIWVLSGKGFYCAMETYALQPFVMKQKTTFRYDEYLVKVRAFAFRDGAREHSLDDLGGGAGLVEDASGYLL
ncbi:Uncharacterised protein [uncultured archaeon]|nr:Uncharacterised protein [uncultured archaeon]